MARDLVCPNCGTVIRPSTTVQTAYDAYLAIVLGGASSKAFGASRGLAPSTVTWYRRLGIALAVVGIEADSTIFRDLAGGGGAMIKEVGRAIETPNATPESVEAVLRRHIDANGTRLKAPSP